MSRRSSLQGQWSSRFAFVLAATGSAIGLGSVWRFPFAVGENGGGTFVTTYLLAVLCIGLPLMMAEVMLGRRGRRNPITAMTVLSEEETGHAGWRLVGFLGVATGLLILSYYSVIAGWMLSYAARLASGASIGGDAASAAAAFGALRSDPLQAMLWHSAFLATAAWLVGRGVVEGLERAVKVTMPVLVLLLVLLVAWAATHGDLARALAYLFEGDPSHIDAPMVLAAFAQAFFTLSIGVGALMAYGAYLPAAIRIGGATATVVAANCLVSLLAGLTIFPLAFRHGIDPAQGPGLVFTTLPLAFGAMPGGNLFGALFFLLLVLAALGSAIALLEPAVAWAVERRALRRPRAALAVAGVVWLLGIGSALSANLLAGVSLGRGDLFESIEFATSRVLLPLSALSIALFAGWAMCRSASSEELEIGVGTRYGTWRFAMRWLAPVALVGVGLAALAGALRG
jgi:NSS family neurotransmitter:Na+ symporter